MDEVVDPKAHIAAFLDRFGRERNLTLPPLSDDGVGSVQRGSAVVSIHVLADRGVLLLLAKVASAPELDVTQARRLLTASFVETGDAAFALHPGYVATGMTRGQGTVAPADSALSLIRLMDTLPDAASGTFWHARGHPLPW